MTMKTTEQLHDFDEVDFLDTDEDIAEYLAASLETGMPPISRTHWASSPGPEA